MAGDPTLPVTPNPHPRVLIFSPYTQWLVHAQVDAVIGGALKVRGADVVALRCGGFYEECAISRGPRPCATCPKVGDLLFDMLRVEHKVFEGVLRPTDRAAAEEWAAAVTPETYTTARYEGLDIGAWALPSVLTHYRVLPDSLGIAHIWATAKRYLVDTLLTYIAMARIVDAGKPDVLILFNARLYPFRAAFEAARAHGVTVLVHERGYVGNSFMVYENKTILGTSHLSALFEIWKDIHLDEGELEQVGAALEGRRTGRSLNQPLFYGAGEVKVPDIRHRLNIPDGAKVFGVFTSSQDEYSSYEGYQASGNQAEFLDNLFEAFRGRDEYVVVRHHPHISGAPYDPPEVDMMARYYEQARRAPPNVRIIQAGERLTSYDLLPVLDGAIAPFSTFALETAFAGVPTAVYATMPHAGVFTHRFVDLDPASIGALADAMLAAGPEVIKTDIIRACRFYRWIYQLNFSLEFKTIKIRDGYSPELEGTYPETLMPGSDPALDHLCDRILRGAPLYIYPQPWQRERSKEAEQRFIDRRTSEIARLWHDHAAVQAPLLTATPAPVAVLAVRGRRAGPTTREAGGWLERLRYRNVIAGTLDGLAQAPARAVLTTALARPEITGADAVLLHPDGIQYEEAALTNAMEALAAAGDIPAKVVLMSGWVMVSIYRMLHFMLFKNLDRQALRGMVDRVPLLRDPVHLLALTVWRPAALAAFVAALPEDIDDAQLLEHLLDVLASPSVRSLDSGQFMIHLA